MIESGLPSVVVTGATGGIGEAIAERFSIDGHKVSAWGRSGTKVGDHNVQCDISDDTSVKYYAKDVIETLGVPGAIIHSAAISEDANVMQSSPEAFAKIYDVNVIGAVRLVQAFAPAMIKKGSGSFIFISSINSQFATPNLAAYAASKGALDNLTKTLALELSEQGIRVNAVSPASIETPLLLDKFDQLPDPVGALANNVKRHPLGRIGTPVDVANLVYFLASEEASWMTGGIHLVDGGAHITRR